MKILITGGAGYIGSHAAIEFLIAGHDILVLDDFSNGHVEALNRAMKIAGSTFRHANVDLCDQAALDAEVLEFQPEIVVHFSGLKSVSESVSNPVHYYWNNVAGSLCLLSAMDKAECHRIVFSSSATVYGTPHYLPYDEKHPTAPVNPYGFSKLMTEQTLKDWATVSEKRSAISLRYFNPVGAHPSGLIGEDPKGAPNNLMPYLSQVAIGRREKLHIFGGDYETRDGTGERDYIHVMDLAQAHVNAVEYAAVTPGYEVINLGTGTGITVLELLKAFETHVNEKIPYEIGPRRAGDLARVWAGTTKARDILGWTATFDCHDMCRDMWNWQCRNPGGYEDGLRNTAC